MKGKILASAFAALAASACSTLAAEQTFEGWELSIPSSGLVYNTSTGLARRGSVEREGLISVTQAGGRTMVKHWPAAAFRPQVEIDGEIVISGFAEDEVSRIRSLRLSRRGEVAVLRSGKGPKSKVELVVDGRTVRNWPRDTIVSVTGFDDSGLRWSEETSAGGRYAFHAMGRSADGMLDPLQSQQIGTAEGCILLSSREVRGGLALELACDPLGGSDVYFLDDKGVLSPLAQSQADEIPVSGVDGAAKGEFTVLSVSGTPAARQFFHAVSAMLLRETGEPGAHASDEAGTQSWSQSYRTRLAAELFAKTGHGVFADLAKRAMADTLARRNQSTGIGGANNPGCGWASRIYSEDQRSPVSFLINQAMIQSSLVAACSKLGEGCDALRSEIDTNSVCLAKEYEPLFDREAGLYRTPYGINFRYDGMWSPWNWQLAFAPVIEHAGRIAANPEWQNRGTELAGRFLSTWEADANGALWRYWPQQYYAGWNAPQKISKSMPARKADGAAPREDLNHAGITLMGLSAYEIDADKVAQTRSRLDWLLGNGIALPREMDGKGPVSAKWFPGAGFVRFATPLMHQRFARKLPMAAGDQDLAQGLLFDPAAEFDLKLTLLACSAKGCRTLQNWSFDSAQNYLSASPLFGLARTSR